MRSGSGDVMFLVLGQYGKVLDIILSSSRKMSKTYRDDIFMFQGYYVPVSGMFQR
jgi:hypothetical protein